MAVFHLVVEEAPLLLAHQTDLAAQRGQAHVGIVLAQQ